MHDIKIIIFLLCNNNFSYSHLNSSIPTVHAKKEMHSRDVTVLIDLLLCTTSACFSTFFFNLLLVENS